MKTGTGEQAHHCCRSQWLEQLQLPKQVCTDFSLSSCSLRSKPIATIYCQWSQSNSLFMTHQCYVPNHQAGDMERADWVSTKFSPHFPPVLEAKLSGYLAVPVLSISQHCQTQHGQGQFQVAFKILCFALGKWAKEKQQRQHGVHPTTNIPVLSH